MVERWWKDGDVAQCAAQSSLVGATGQCQRGSHLEMFVALTNSILSAGVGSVLHAE
jgi:hypothetical protein